MESKKPIKSKASARQIINSTLCLDISQIQKQSPIQKRPYATHGVVKTEAGMLISYESNYGNEQAHSLEIIYAVTPDISYYLTVNIIEVRSNLGKGSFLYFICPQTGRKCRKLYKLPLDNNWGSRGAFKGQLYYPIQICSRLQALDQKFWDIEIRINKSTIERHYNSYRGQSTKRYLKSQLFLSEKKKALSDLCEPNAFSYNIKKVIPMNILVELQKLVYRFT